MEIKIVEYKKYPTEVYIKLYEPISSGRNRVEHTYVLTKEHLHLIYEAIKDYLK